MQLASSLVLTHWPHQILAEKGPIRNTHAIFRLDWPITVEQAHQDLSCSPIFDENVVFSNTSLFKYLI